MKITRSVVDFMIRTFNSRFLKKTASGDWEEITIAAARDKVSHALRFSARQLADRAALASCGMLLAEKPKTQAKYQAEARSRMDTISIMAKVQKPESERSMKVELNTPPASAMLSQDETEFNSMRTADLEDILGEPLKEDEWEAVSALAMANPTKT